MIFDGRGRRKYLTRDERRRFLAASALLPDDEHTFCLMLAHSGCRISEALQFEQGQLDLETRAVIVRSLKKRDRQVVHRAIPLPSPVLKTIGRWARTVPPTKRLWPWSRGKGWLVVKRVMANASIEGLHACPKGLRHGFGVAALQSGVPLNLVQRWLGHAKIETTAIYTNVIGDEERALARRMWRDIKGDRAA